MQVAFLRGLTKTIRRLQLDGRIDVARMCATSSLLRPRAHPQDPVRPHHCACADAPFGDRQLRLDCTDHDAASSEQAAGAWERFAAAELA